MAQKSDFRLPENVRPLRYQVTLEPNLEKFTFDGSADIGIVVNEETDTIVLNAIELQIASAVITDKQGGTAKATDIIFDQNRERVSIILPSQLEVGNHTLHLKFSGYLNDQLRGFYRSRYLDAEGAEHFMATTQFEATDARRAIPCWDEPSVKAIFEITLVVPNQLQAISNMPVIEEVMVANGKKAVSFEATPLMSTYLLAFVVGDLACVEGHAVGGTLIRVWATKGKEHLGQFALENSINALSYMNEYFGIDYPLPKMDHIAIPDFAAGAMENWGAITYRETALLYDPENSAAQIKQRVLEVVAHEMAHMWFGDLVTMEWWDDLWLNESFASWMGDKTVNHLYPEWQMWTQFVSHDTNAALSLDGLRNSHSIEANVDDPAEIRELFDAISYSKGGSVLRMLENYVGPETFKKGLNIYLTDHAYSNAQGRDLWHAINDAANQSNLNFPISVIDLMEAWIKKIGYPVLRVHIGREDQKTAVEFSQQRFLYDYLIDKTSQHDLWPIHASVMTASGNTYSSTFAEASDSLEIGESTSWVKLNSGQTGFYRVAYAEDEWIALSSAIRDKALPAVDRLGLQNDAYALARSGHLPGTIFLTLANSFIDEDDAIVWGDLASNLKGLEGLLGSAPFLPDYREFARKIFGKIVSKTGWEADENETHLKSLLRSIVIGQYGAYGDQSTIDFAVQSFKEHAAATKIARPDIRGVVFGLAAQESNPDTYDELWNLYKKADLNEEKVRILSALTRVRDPQLINDLLNRTMGDEVRSQDAPGVIIQLANHAHGLEIAWDFLKANWKEFDRRYGKGGFAIMRLVSIGSNFSSSDKEDEVREFFQVNPAPSAARTIEQTLESIRLNTAWIDANQSSVEKWLKMQ